MHFDNPPPQPAAFHLASMTEEQSTAASPNPPATATATTNGGNHQATTQQPAKVAATAANVGNLNQQTSLLNSSAAETQSSHSVALSQTSHSSQPHTANQGHAHVGHAGHTHVGQASRAPVGVKDELTRTESQHMSRASLELAAEIARFIEYLENELDSGLPTKELFYVRTRTACS